MGLARGSLYYLILSLPCQRIHREKYAQTTFDALAEGNMVNPCLQPSFSMIGPQSFAPNGPPIWGMEG
jgi:hypothetical protein